MKCERCEVDLDRVLSFSCESWTLCARCRLEKSAEPEDGSEDEVADEVV